MLTGKSRPIKGTELNTTLILVPGAEYGRRPHPSTGGPGQPITPPPPAEDVDWGVIWLKATDGFTRNLGGSPILQYDLGDTNPVFSEVVAYEFPGAGGDDNDIQWEIAIDPMMDPTDPEISVRLHFLIPL